jgi:hypothetical protein
MLGIFHRVLGISPLCEAEVTHLVGHSVSRSFGWTVDTRLRGGRRNVSRSFGWTVDTRALGMSCRVCSSQLRLG